MLCPTFCLRLMLGSLLEKQRGCSHFANINAHLFFHILCEVYFVARGEGWIFLEHVQTQSSLRLEFFISRRPRCAGAKQVCVLKVGVTRWGRPLHKHQFSPWGGIFHKEIDLKIWKFYSIEILEMVSYNVLQDARYIQVQVLRSHVGGILWVPSVPANRCHPGPALRRAEAHLARLMSKESGLGAASAIKEHHGAPYAMRIPCESVRNIKIKLWSR